MIKNNTIMEYILLPKYNFVKDIIKLMQIKIVTMITTEQF